MNEYIKNSSGYIDTTAGKALSHIDYEERHRKHLINTLKHVARLSGYTIINRIMLEDNKTGQIYH